MIFKARHMSGFFISFYLDTITKKRNTPLMFYKPQKNPYLTLSFKNKLRGIYVVSATQQSKHVTNLRCHYVISSKREALKLTSAMKASKDTFWGEVFIDKFFGKTTRLAITGIKTHVIYDESNLLVSGFIR